MYTSEIKRPGSLEAVAAYDSKLGPITGVKDEGGRWWVTAGREKIRANSPGEAAKYTQLWARNRCCPLPRESRRPA